MSGPGALTPEFVFDLESRMRMISAAEYERLNTPESQAIVRALVKEVPTQTKRELMHWFLDTAQIQVDEEGTIEFEGLMMHQHEFDHEFARKGLKVLKSELEDLDGQGVRIATEWARQIGAQIAYRPVELAANALINGDTALCYDGGAFFATNHPVNPAVSGGATYSNLLTTGVKLDDRHSVETALESLGAIRTAIASIPMPNGSQPRKLRAKQFIAPPAMMDRLTMLTKAKFIATSDGGPTDVENVIARWGLAPPIECDEIGAAFGGSDTDCYLAVEQLAGDELGALVYLNREPFAITYYSGDAGGGLNAELARTDELQWMVKGRNKMHYGHPFLLFKLVGQAP